MIPVRIPADLMPVLAGERRWPAANGWCPVCNDSLANGRPVVLVFCGIDPEDRKEGPNRWTTGGAVAVHAQCAGVPDGEPS